MSKIGPSPFGTTRPSVSRKSGQISPNFSEPNYIRKRMMLYYASFESKHGYQSLTFTKNVFLHIGQQIMTIKEVYESHNKIEQMTTE